MSEPDERTGWQLAVEGMERSYAAAPEEWKAAAMEAIFTAACDLPELTADDVWKCFPKGYQISNGSALGHAMRAAKKEGWIVNTGEHRLGTRPEMHCKPVPIWRSLIHGEKL